MSLQGSDTVTTAADGAADPVAAVRVMWGLGDYHRFAKATVWDLGPVLVEACGVRAGQRVLDVAAGSGNVALRAAARGATVVASDLTSEGFPAGRREAQARGVDLEWVEADAQSLPFADGEFDVVTSCFGAMFAPDHRAAADEMLRVCRPGGTIGLISFTPEGLGGAFFDLLGGYLPPPPAGAESPLLWGREDHVRALFEGRVQSLTASRRTYVERADDPTAYCTLVKTTFGPAVAAYAGLAGPPDRRAALDEALLRFAVRADRGAPGDAAEYPYEYLLVVAHTAV
jgi:SAM-dependent methyltransferase